MDIDVVVYLSGQPDTGLALGLLDPMPGDRHEQQLERVHGVYGFGLRMFEGAVYAGAFTDVEPQDILDHLDTQDWGQLRATATLRIVEPDHMVVFHYPTAADLIEDASEASKAGEVAPPVTREAQVDPSVWKRETGWSPPI